MKKKRSNLVVRSSREHQPVIWTGEALLDRALFLAGFRKQDLREALNATRRGLTAKLPEKRVHKTLMTKDGPENVIEVTEGGAPDYDAQLKAAEQVYGIVGLRAGRKLAEAAGGIVPVIAVTIVHEPSANGHARTALPSHGIVIHHDGDQRNGA